MPILASKLYYCHTEMTGALEVLVLTFPLVNRSFAEPHVLYVPAHQYLLQCPLGAMQNRHRYDFKLGEIKI